MRPAATQLLRAELGQALPGQTHRAGRRLQQLQDAFAERGLAGAGLAHQRQGAAARQRQRHTVHCIEAGGRAPEPARFNGETDVQVIDLQQGLFVVSRRGSRYVSDAACL